MNEGDRSKDSNATAQSAKTASLPKRFYKDVAVKDEGGRAAVLLDGRPVRTPGKAPLSVPNKALAEAIAE